MSYFVTESAGDRMFRYTVWEGTEYPGCSIVHVCMTMRGAKRLIRKDRARKAKALEAHPLGYPVTVHRETDYADLPDLRKSEYAP